VLGREAVVDRDGAGARVARDVGGQRGRVLRRAHHVRAAVQVEQDVVGLGHAVDGDLDDGDAAERAGREHHVVGQRVDGEELQVRVGAVLPPPALRALADALATLRGR
jgi:hypothetical protein